VHDRGVRFARVFNFRDLGGYPTADGHTVRWRRLFRADDLSRLDEEDREAFAALGIRTVVDLRRPNEVSEDGRIPQFDGFKYHHIHLVHPQWPAQEFADTSDRVAYVSERYRELCDAGADGLGETLRLIADAECAPMVFHCIAGKDRTGVVSALTLSLLGVPDDLVADDYELSEAAEPLVWAYRESINPDLRGKRWLHIAVSPRQAVIDFLADLRGRFGSVAGFAESVGVSREHVDAMRAHLLSREPAGSP
jgi:protein-tyrosine phosphatase